MRTELVTIPTPTLPLDGAWHLPDEGQPVTGAVLLFHGNTMNFYTGAPRFLPPYLTRLGFACLAFNRRGHDILAIRDSRAAEGAAFQTTAEGIEDNRIAAEWVAAKGFPAPIVIGHSNGGMLAVRHVVDHPETPALVLLSAHRGGQHMSLSGKLGLMTLGRSEEFEAKAKQMVAEGRGKELMFMPGWWYVITPESYLDRMYTMPDTVGQAPQIKCPVYYVRGDQEIREMYPAEEFAARSTGRTDVEIVPDCDHFYRNREDHVAELVSAWLAKTLPAK